VIRVVYDTNIIVSGLLNPEGIPSFLLDLAAQGYIRLFLSEKILKEYKEVLMRPKFRFLSKACKKVFTKTSGKGRSDKTKNHC
jgi:putative PIN family toxin of toxin-antitoxin system